MTTVRTIIKDAYRESNLIPESQDPSADQFAEGLRLLNRLVDSILTFELGDPFEDIVVGSNNISEPTGLADYYEDQINNSFLPQNSRLFLNLNEAKTVYLHPIPDDGCLFSVVDTSGNLATNNLTVVGNGRTIETALNQVLSTNGATETWFYRAELGDWKKVTSLTESSEFPFPRGFDNYFIIGLAMRLNPRNGAVLTQESAFEYKRQKSQFRSRYGQVIPAPTEEGIVRMSSRNRVRRHEDTTHVFNKGSIRW